MTSLKDLRETLVLSLDSVPLYEDLTKSKECEHIIDPMMKYMKFVAENLEYDIDVDPRIFNYIPVLFMIYPSILKLYFNNYTEVEEYCMGAIISEFHDKNTDKSYETVVEFLSSVEEKLKMIRRFVLQHKPYFHSDSFERCRRSVNAHSRGLKLAFEKNEVRKKR